MIQASFHYSFNQCMSECLISKDFLSSSHPLKVWLLSTFLTFWKCRRVEPESNSDEILSLQLLTKHYMTQKQRTQTWHFLCTALNQLISTKWNIYTVRSVPKTENSHLYVILQKHTSHCWVEEKNWKIFWLNVEILYLLECRRSRKLRRSTGMLVYLREKRHSFLKIQQKGWYILMEQTVFMTEK